MSGKGSEIDIGLLMMKYVIICKSGILFREFWEIKGIKWKINVMNESMCMN